MQPLIVDNKINASTSANQQCSGAWSCDTVPGVTEPEILVLFTEDTASLL
jgi:hypothetical protein